MDIDSKVYVTPARALFEPRPHRLLRAGRSPVGTAPAVFDSIGRTVPLGALLNYRKKVKENVAPVDADGRIGLEVVATSYR
jgi:hypothetical protein